jgi:hypothetical protein
MEQRQQVNERTASLASGMMTRTPQRTATSDALTPPPTERPKRPHALVAVPEEPYQSPRPAAKRPRGLGYPMFRNKSVNQLKGETPSPTAKTTQLKEIVDRQLPVSPIGPDLICAVAGSKGGSGAAILGCIQVHLETIARSDYPSILDCNMYALVQKYQQLYGAWQETAEVQDNRETELSNYPTPSTFYGKTPVEKLYDFFNEIRSDLDSYILRQRASANVQQEE